MRLKTCLSTIPDHRRAQGRLYALEYLLLFSILAILSDATSYRKLQRFIQARLERLNTLCGLKWKRAPAHTALRYALKGLDPVEVEAAFRCHAAVLDGPRGLGGDRAGWQTLARQLRSVPGSEGPPSVQRPSDRQHLGVGSRADQRCRGRQIT